MTNIAAQFSKRSINIFGYCYYNEEMVASRVIQVLFSFYSGDAYSGKSLSNHIFFIKYDLSLSLTTLSRKLFRSNDFFMVLYNISTCLILTRKWSKYPILKSFYWIKIGYFDHFRVRIKHVDILYKTIKKSFDLSNFWESVVRLRESAYLIKIYG